MKKQIFLTTAMAASLTALPGCSSNDDWNEDVFADNDTAICVNEAGDRVDDEACEDGGFGVFGYYGKRYYLNRGSRIPYYGDSIRDSRYAFKGSYASAPGVNYAKAPVASNVTRSAAVARGGFGSSSRSFGGGRS